MASSFGRVRSRRSIGVAAGIALTAALAASCDRAPVDEEESLGSQTAALSTSFQNGAGAYNGTVDGYISGFLPGNTQRATVFNEVTLPVWHNTANQAYQAESIIRFTNLTLPAGAQVSSATLTLTFDNWYTGFTLTGYYLKNSWTEAQVGWVARDTGLNWSTPGAKGSGTDIHAGLSFSSSAWAGNGVEVKTFNLDPAIVQSWISSPATNLGVILTNNLTTNKYLRVYSSEEPTVSRRPLLTINYSVPSGNCATSTPASIYNQGFTSQSGSFTITADAIPAAGSADTGFGINSSPPVGETNNWHTAATFRFNSATGQIDVRNGSTYVAPTPAVPFSFGSTYRFRAVVNVPAHTYTAYVTPPGQSEVLLGSGLAFRSNYAGATSLNNVRGTVDAGSVQICNVQVTGACTPETNAAFCARLGKNCGQLTGTDNCGAARTVSSCGSCSSPQTCGGSGTANVCGGGSPSAYDSGVTVHLERALPTSVAWVSFGVPVPPGRLASASTVRVFRSGETTPIAGVKVKPLMREHGASGAAGGVRAVLVQIPASAIAGSAADVNVTWSGGAAPSDTVPFTQVSAPSAETVATAQRTITQSGSTCSLVETSTATQTLFSAREPVFVATFPPDYLPVTGILGSLKSRPEVVATSNLAGVKYLSDNVTPFGLSSMYLESYRLNPAADSVVDPIANYEGWLYDRCATYLSFYAHTGDVRFLRTAYRHCAYYASKIDAAGIFTGKPNEADIKYSHIRGLYAYYALTGDEAAFTAGQNIANLWLSEPTFVVPYRQGHIRGPDKLWTERLLGTALEGLYYGHRLLNDTQYFTALSEMLTTAYTHLTTSDQATLNQIMTLPATVGTTSYPTFPPQNCFIHNAVQHAEGNADQPWCSGWMTELTIDALLEYQKQTGDTRVDDMFIRLARSLRDVGSVYWVENFGYYDDTFLNPNACYNPNAGSNRRQLVPAYGAALRMNGTRYKEHEADEEHCADAAGLMAVAIRALKRRGLYDQGGPIGPFPSEGASFLQMLHEFSFCAGNRFSAWTRPRRDPAVWTSAELCPGVANPAAFISNNKIGYPKHQIGPQRKLSWWFNQSLVQYALLQEAGISIPQLQPGIIEPCP